MARPSESVRALVNRRTGSRTRGRRTRRKHRGGGRTAVGKARNMPAGRRGQAGSGGTHSRRRAGRVPRGPLRCRRTARKVPGGGPEIRREQVAGRTSRRRVPLGPGAGTTTRCPDHGRPLGTRRPPEPVGRPCPDRERARPNGPPAHRPPVVPRRTPRAATHPERRRQPRRWQSRTAAATGGGQGRPRPRTTAATAMAVMGGGGRGDGSHGRRRPRRWQSRAAAATDDRGQGRPRQRQEEPSYPRRLAGVASPAPRRRPRRAGHPSKDAGRDPRSRPVGAPVLPAGAAGSAGAVGPGSSRHRTGMPRSRPHPRHAADSSGGPAAAEVFSTRSGHSPW